MGALGSRKSRARRHARTFVPGCQRATAGAVLLAGLAFSAMGLSAPSAPPAGAAGSAGVLTEAYDLTGQSGDPVVFDVTQSHVPGDQIPWTIPIYDTLLRYTPSGALVPELASSATIADPSTIDLTLRPGVTFSDGTPFDADAVKAGILRNEQAPQNGEFDATLEDVSSIDVNSPTSLVIHLSQPAAGAFYPLLAGEETFIPSPAEVAKGDLSTQPVGAGPFVLQQFSPNQRIVLAKNPTYWDAKAIKLSQLQFTSVPAATQQLSALQAGQANLAVGLPATDIPALRHSNSLQLSVVNSPTSNLWMPLCKTYPPLAKVQVRQALSYAVDRSAISNALLEGAGSPQWALWPQNSIYYPASLTNHYAYNVAKAKQLLKAAGYAKGFNLTLIELAGVPLTTQVAQVVQQEWKQIGVNVTLQPSSSFVPDLYIHHLGQTTVNPTHRGGLLKLTGTYHPGSIGDLCDYDSPTLDAISNQIAGLVPTSPKAVQLWKSAQTYVIDNALSVYIAWIPQVSGSAKTVKGLNLITSYLIAIPDLWTVQVSG